MRFNLKRNVCCEKSQALIFSRLVSAVQILIWSRIQVLFAMEGLLVRPLILPNFASFRLVQTPSSWKLPNLRPFLVGTKERKMRRPSPLVLSHVHSARENNDRRLHYFDERPDTCPIKSHRVWIIKYSGTTGVRLIYSKARHARHFMKNIKVPRKFISPLVARARTHTHKLVMWKCVLASIHCHIWCDHDTT